VRQALAQPRVVALPPSPDIAVAAALLDPDAFPGGPIDRMIYATARDAGAVLVTRDRALHAFDGRNTIW
jgi:PIN domain nuclease of toxin-antitoxin system